MNQDQAIIKETLAEVKAALVAVVGSQEMKQNRFGLWFKCKHALDHLEDVEPRLEQELVEAERLRAEAERLTPASKRKLTPEEIQARIDDNFFDEEYA